MTEADDFVRVDGSWGTYHPRGRCIPMIETLELLGKRGTPLELEAVVGDRFILWRFEDIDSALVLGAVVLHFDLRSSRQETLLSLDRG